MAKDPGRWRRYAQYYRGKRRVLLLTVALSAGQSLIVVPAAWLVRRAFNQAIPGSSPSALVLIALALGGLFMVKVAVALVARRLALSTTKDAIAAIRMDLLAVVYSLPCGAFARDDRAGVQHVIVQDSERVDVMSNALIGEAAPAAVLAAVLSAWLLRLNAALFLFTVAIVPASVLVSRLIGQRVQRQMAEFHHEFERFSARVWRALRSLDLARAHAAEARELAEQRQVVDALRVSSEKTAWTFASYHSLQTAITAGMGLVIVMLGGTAVARGSMSLGDLASFYVGAVFLAAQLGTIVGAVPLAIEGDESLSAVSALLARAAPPPYSGTRVIDFTGRLTLEHVSFGYEDRPVLEGVSFEIPARTSVAIVGPNGSGKSTLTRLVLGFHRPGGGRLLADGVPYDELDIAALRRRTGVVLQDPPMLNATVFENIAYAAPHATRADVEHAAALATADAFIADLPEGYDTVIGEDAARLSAGQRQRLALARALVGRPSLLVLDEPTTHLDADAVARLLDTLSSLPQRPTVLLTTHDPDVARRCGRLLSLDAGVTAP